MDQDVDSDTWLAETRRAGILPQRLLSTNVDVYRPPPVQTSTSASMMHQDLFQLRSLQRSNASALAELMRRHKDEGLMERPKYSSFQVEDQADHQSGAGTSWLRRPDSVQGMQAETRHKSPQSSTHFSNDATLRSIPNAQHLARLAESSSRHHRQEKIHDMKAVGVDIVVNTASESSEKQAQMSGSDAELKSVSSEDLVEMESTVTARGGRSGRSRRRTATPVSKNLVSERKRRKKLNDGLYSLRALVPKISKMDKASIVGDAIDYVKELKQEVEDIELEISEIERRATGYVSVNESSAGSMLSDCEEREETGAKVVAEQLNNDNVVVTDHAAATESDQDTTPSPDNSQDQLPPVSKTRILNMVVDKLDEQMYQLKISCQNRPGVLVQLTRALESLDLDVLNAYHTSFQESVLNTFIIEMKDLDAQEAEDVRKSLLDAAAQHGLVQA